MAKELLARAEKPELPTPFQLSDDDTLPLDRAKKRPKTEPNLEQKVLVSWVFWIIFLWQCLSFVFFAHLILGFHIRCNSCPVNLEAIDD